MSWVELWMECLLTGGHRLSIGSTPTLIFGMSFRDAAIMVVAMQLLFILPTLYILTLGPQLGMRQSVQFRYVFG